METDQMNTELRERLRRVRVLALDHDGVLATLKITMGIIMPRESAQIHEAQKREFETVIEAATYDHRDGRGIDRVRECGVEVVIVTNQRSGFVLARGWKMGVPVVQTKNKLQGLTTWLGQNHPKLLLNEVCFVGDDDSDIEVMKMVGVAVCVADGLEEAKQIAHYVTRCNGGDGAVREVCDLVIAAQKLGETS